MNSLFELLALLVVIGVVIFYVHRLFSTRIARGNRTLIGGKGWYFISKRQMPYWLRCKWGDDCIQCSHGTVFKVFEYARGNHYEYKLVGVNAGHHHEGAVIRRRLRRHK